MKSLVSDESEKALEDFLTMLTLVRFLLAVTSLVLSEMGTEAKGFATHTAGVRLLPSVNPLMLS